MDIFVSPIGLSVLVLVVPFGEVMTRARFVSPDKPAAWGQETPAAKNGGWDPELLDTLDCSIRSRPPPRPP